MRRLTWLAVIAVAGCGTEPSNNGRLHIRVVMHKPTDQDIIVDTGGPPFLITGNPAESRGLSGSYRIASDREPLNAGPGVDWWGGSVDTFRAHRGAALEETLSLRDWQAAGWVVEPGVYRVRSYYNGKEGESETFVVTAARSGF